MHYISVQNLTKSYGVNPLFENISFHINEGDKIALISRNGAGKSTLLNILSGKEVQDDGKVWINKDTNVVLLEQDPSFDENISVLDNIFTHKNVIIDTIKEYERICEENDPEALIAGIEKMDNVGAWDFEATVKQILTQLNINHLTQPLKTLSGGQRKRVALAKTLIDIGFEPRHTFLILDEPTNHLDIGMVEWLENYLDKENITVLLVTHDRYFLDAVCKEIWEIDNQQLYVFKGNYENYLEKKAARLESTQATIDKARNTYKKELEWIRKQPKARTTKSKSRVDNFAEVEKVAKQQIENNQLKLQVKMSRLGGKIAELKKVYKSFEDKTILKGFDYTFSKGERIGIIGKNGSGKSTFIKLLQGFEKPDSGKINIGDTVVFGNFSQQGLEIKEDQRVIEFVKNIAENFPLATGGSLSAAQFLQLFLFEPDKQYTYISKLSGGERKRLQLLSILFKNPNFLVLDEPTNDLDLPTLQVLESFLSEFGGCLIVISHDRYFMDKLVDHLLLFEGDGEIKDFPGNYTQFRNEKPEKAAAIKQAENLKEIEKEPIESPLKTRKISYKEKREFELLKQELETLASEKKLLIDTLNNPGTPFETLNQTSQKIAAISEKVDELEMRWLELSEIME